MESKPIWRSIAGFGIKPVLYTHWVCGQSHLRPCGSPLLNVRRRTIQMIQPATKTNSRDRIEFQTNFRYSDRKSKAEYVWRKYRSLLQNASVLDVGADQCYLKDHIDDSTTYFGIGLGGNPDQQVDLESGKLPFEPKRFDCVLCLDVLEHIESIHSIFDELCRVSRQSVVISLPNPWANFWRMLRKGHAPEMPFKFYGLPEERPEDRHRWFFGADDAMSFIEARAERNHFEIRQMDFGQDDRNVGRLVRLKRRIQTLGLSPNIDRSSLYAGSIWAVLERVE